MALVAWPGERRLRAAARPLAGLVRRGPSTYIVAHRLLYGGWTVYAAGDHFAGGELTVMGTDPDRIGRSRRLAGLLLDRGFGLAAWMPGYLLAVPALRGPGRRRPGWVPLVVPLAAGWATATWVALTMHGWWWPGRQVVVWCPAWCWPSPGGRPSPAPAASWWRPPPPSASWSGRGWWSRSWPAAAR